MFRKALCLAALGGVACLMGGRAAQANILAPGDSGVSPDVFGTVTGTFLASTGTGSYTEKDALGNTVGTGSYIEYVMRDGVSGHLDFAIMVSPSTGDIGRVTTTNYATWVVDGGDATTLTDGSTTHTSGTVAPMNEDRNASGAVVGFNFPTGSPGFVSGSSEFLVLKTNADTFSAGSISIIDGGTANVVGFAPAVPTPATVWGGLGLFGLVGGGHLIRRRQLA